MYHTPGKWVHVPAYVKYTRDTDHIKVRFRNKIKVKQFI